MAVACVSKPGCRRTGRAGADRQEAEEEQRVGGRGELRQRGGPAGELGQAGRIPRHRELRRLLPPHHGPGQH